MASEANCRLGFDLGGTKMFATVYDTDFRPLGRARKKTKGTKGAEKGLARMKEVIAEALDEAGVQADGLTCIGVGAPGPLDLDQGLLINTPNLGWTDVPLKDELEAAFGCPSFILNDVDAGTYGEYRFGAARDTRCTVGIFPGTGIGGACIYEGTILRGRIGSAMEIGHMQMVPDGPRCGCGQRGCLEAMASRLAIASAAAAAACRGQAPWLLKEYGTDPAAIRSSALAGAVKNGDTAVERILRDAAHWLGIGTAGIVNLLGPDAVVIGGGLAEAMPEFFADEISRTADEHVMPPFRGTFRVKTAELGDDAGVLGAAAWAEQQIRRNNT